MAGGLSASRWSWRSKSAVNVPLQAQKQSAIHGNRWNLNPQTPRPPKNLTSQAKAGTSGQKKRNSKEKKIEQNKASKKSIKKSEN